ILIGAVIAAFTLSGAIPTLIYYGLALISPNVFLPIGMLLCSMMSLAIGSTWGTIGTMGVALMGVGSILHIPLPIVAGMVVSGAYFGDKFSPISDTTILSAMTTETNLYKHIKGMTYSMIPAYVLSLAIFAGIGKYYTPVQSVSFTELATIRDLIQEHFYTGFITLLPLLVMFCMSVKKKPAELSMLTSLVVALGIAFFVQKVPIAEGLNALFSGASFKHTGSSVLDAALNRGGIQSMLWSMSLAILVLVLGGLLDSYRFIQVLFERWVTYLKTPLQLVFTTMIASVLFNLLMGEAYLSIILSSRIFKSSYKKMDLDSCLLSKAIEEGSTFSTPLIPWTTSGAFVA
ncbi:MAG: Na+/H+ antiporter NhaC family protein, partial [Methylococcales bacterium]|nr:Na+/H+ antiporter NhaC family protein [Methylococcales bacterium]